jgi:hypothetical protein
VLAQQPRPVFQVGAEVTRPAGATDRLIVRNRPEVCGVHRLTAGRVAGCRRRVAAILTS